MRRYSRITGTGSSLPPRRLTNADLVAELAQRAVDGHARHIELLDQRGLAGDGLAFLPYATVDLLQHMVFDALERRYGGGGIGSRHRVCLDQKSCLDD
mgnify:CR=1 FL=1